MVELQDITAPLVVRLVDGGEKVVAACFPHPQGMLYLDTFWHLKTPQEAAHLVRGKLRGNGPWRVGDVTVRVLGCPNTDPDLQHDHIAWRDYLEQHQSAYPPREQILEIARHMGAHW